MAAWALLRQSSEEVSGRDSKIMATAALGGLGLGFRVQEFRV